MVKGRRSHIDLERYRGSNTTTPYQQFLSSDLARPTPTSSVACQTNCVKFSASHRIS
jgi:hypothetical protein